MQSVFDLLPKFETKVSLNSLNLSKIEKSLSKNDLGFGLIETNFKFFRKNPLELLWIKLCFLVAKNFCNICYLFLYRLFYQDYCIL